MDNQELEQERERIKKIFLEELKREFNMRRLQPYSRFEHIREHLFFKIDNPDYVRKWEKP